mmetsp:Transcript_6533/g.6094  ORF Transcript_6533/g.6094 Transcript_6533/m.6094 type:complete len:151 (+) Transcript_6533:1049-1501(+)|eukprot:CAMPEP_0197006518 /NCGR_PEP_ID=MMETSP1380-20130617/35431_1 /TAXON_ID=5936 /ORGANISM="Euplotes crassus, Strain CT5" /LENGTH=150 /DNA_ID=CAMNT_0042426129 /DNA_START=1049 /DNA_END=1501 /DNA_ORIENTATION=-
MESDNTGGAPKVEYKKKEDEFSENNKLNIFTMSKTGINISKKSVGQGLKSISPFSSVDEGKDSSKNNIDKNGMYKPKPQIKISYEEEPSPSIAMPHPLIKQPPKLPALPKDLKNMKLSFENQKPKWDRINNLLNGPMRSQIPTDVLLSLP